MEVGQRIDLLECIDPDSAWSCYGHSWLLKNSFVKGKQEPHLYFGKEGYCVWNAYINSSYYLFKKGYKKIGTFVITKLNEKIKNRR